MIYDINKDPFNRGIFYFNSNKEFNVFKFDSDITKLPPSTNVIIVDTFLMKRPWLISSAAYGVPDLWWFIMKYNGIKRMHTELTEGRRILYPLITEFYKLRDRYAE